MVMVFIVVVSTGPDEQEVVQREREFVTRVGVNCLEQPQGDPNADGEKVQISCEVTPDDRDTNSSES